MTTVIERDAGTRLGRRRSRRRRRVLLVLLVCALGAGGGYAAYRWQPKAHRRAPVASHPERAQRSLLVGIRARAGRDAGMQALALFVTDSDASHPVIAFLPVRTLGQTPGSDAFGPIAEASSIQDKIGLESLTVENVFGLRVDAAFALDDVQLAHLIDAAGGIDADVEEGVPQTKGARPFAQGLQHMSGARALQYLAFGADGDTEVKRFVRAQKVWEGILSKGPTVLTDALAQGGAEDSFLARLVHDLAPFTSVPASARTYDVMPVIPVLAGGKDEAYQVNAADLDDLIARDFPALELGGVKPDERARIELRNGAGTPGLGAKAARILLPQGMKVEVAGNAANFSYGRTLILAYSQDQLPLARKIRDLLGVGDVELSSSGQTVVDVTVILGKDLARRS